MRAAPAPLLLLLVALLAPPAARGHVIFARDTLHDFMSRSQVAVVAEFLTGRETRTAGPGAPRDEYYRVRVTEVLRGALEPGTTLAYLPHAEGTASYRPGQTALVFLEPTAPQPEFARERAHFAWFSVQGPGQEWRFDPEREPAVAEMARGYAALASRPSPDALRALLARALAVNFFIKLNHFVFDGRRFDKP